MSKSRSDELAGAEKNSHSDFLPIVHLLVRVPMKRSYSISSTRVDGKETDTHLPSASSLSFYAVRPPETCFPGTPSILMPKRNAPLKTLFDNAGRRRRRGGGSGDEPRV